VAAVAGVLASMQCETIHVFSSTQRVQALPGFYNLAGPHGEAKTWFTQLLLPTIYSLKQLHLHEQQKHCLPP
jgi:hypothetical protein